MKLQEKQKLGKRVICASLVLMLGVPTLTGILGEKQVFDNVPTSNMFISTVYANEQGNQAFREGMNTVLGTTLLSKSACLADAWQTKELRDKFNQNKTLLGTVVESHYPDLIGHWASGEFAPSLYLGLIQGYPDGTIQPDKVVSRAELAVMAASALYGDQVASKDINALQVEQTGGQKWFAGHWASAEGLMPLYDTKTDMSSEYMEGATRAEVAYVIARTYFNVSFSTYYEKASQELNSGNYSIPDVTKVTSYEMIHATADYKVVINDYNNMLRNQDNEIPVEYYAALLLLKDKGVMSGDTAGNSMYANRVTRAETVSLINRAIKTRAVTGM